MSKETKERKKQKQKRTHRHLLGNCVWLSGRMYVCVVTHIAKVASPARGQLNGENEYFSLSPFGPEKLLSRDEFGSPVPRQPAHLHAQAESGSYLQDSSRVPRRRPFIYCNRRTASGQSRVFGVTQFCTDGVHCRESTATISKNG